MDNLEKQSTDGYKTQNENKENISTTQKLKR